MAAKLVYLHLFYLLQYFFLADSFALISGDLGNGLSKIGLIPRAPTEAPFFILRGIKNGTEKD